MPLSAKDKYEIACHIARGTEKLWKSMRASRRTWQRAHDYIRDSGLTPVGVEGKRLFVVSKEKCGSKPMMRLAVRRARKR